MDLTSHPAHLTEPAHSLEDPGPKNETALSNDFLAHERDDQNESRNDNTSDKIVNIVDSMKTVKPADDSTKNTSIIEDTDVIKTIEDGAENLNNENNKNTDRIENIGTSETKLEETTDQAKEEDNEPKEEEWLDILGSGQLRKLTLKRAENSYRPQRSYVVEINIEGLLPDGTIVDKESNLILQIGDAEHIQALDFVLPLMDVGELALLEVWPRFAYGSQGREPDVPPNTKIMYTVELLSAEEEPETDALSAQRRLVIGCNKRERGNYWYSRHEYPLAIQCYRRALDFLDDIEGGISLPSDDGDENKQDDILKDLLEERLKVYNNLAAAQMKIKAFDPALKSVESVLHCQPDNVKALYRKGKILSEKGEHAQAITVLRQVCYLEPDNKMFRNELTQILNLHREDTKNEKNLYKKMLGQDKLPEDSQPKQNKFQFPWSVAFGTLAALVAGVVAYRYKFI